jgi:aspartate racemase
MKTIGLIGGLSWQSTQTYYNVINTEVNNKLGKNHSAKILLYSFDFEEIEFLQYHSEWEKLNELIAGAGKTLENAGADCLLICSNTMHACADHLEEKVNIPLLHIVEAVGKTLTQDKVKRTGLLGTKFLMQSDMYSNKLRQLFNVEVIIPDMKQIQEINEIIYSELVKGKVMDDSKKRMKSIIQSMEKKDIESIILGCTEIPLLIKQDDCNIPVVDTTEIHAKSAVNYAISIHTSIN